MKSSYLILLALLSVGCSNNLRMHQLLKDNSARAELYSTILNDHHYLTELLDSMKTNDHALMMINSDKAFSSQMKTHDNNMEAMMATMMDKMKNDSSTTKKMCSMMSQDNQTMNCMMETMHQKGLIDKESLEKGKDKLKSNEHVHQH